MKVISFPNWFEQKTLSYIADLFNGQKNLEKGENSFTFDHKTPPDYLTSLYLESSWSKAKRRYPDEPAKGQIELFRMFEHSFLQTSKIMKFPTWLEPGTVGYIAAHFSGERLEDFRDEGDRCRDEYSFVFHHETPKNYLFSSELKRIWSRAKKRYPDEPAKGQIELFRMIEFSFRQTEDHWMTKIQAERWRNRMLATIDKLERLWAEIPSNFMIKIEGSQDMFRADEIIENMPGIEEIRSFIKELECAEPIHGRQAAGQKAEKLHFMRELSSEFKAATGNWKRPQVATIASAIYGVSVQPQDVTRAAEGLVGTSIEDDKFKRTLLINKSDKPPQT